MRSDRSHPVSFPGRGGGWRSTCHGWCAQSIEADELASLLVLEWNRRMPQTVALCSLHACSHAQIQDPLLCKAGENPIV